MNVKSPAPGQAPNPRRGDASSATQNRLTAAQPLSRLSPIDAWHSEPHLASDASQRGPTVSLQAPVSARMADHNQAIRPAPTAIGTDQDVDEPQHSSPLSRIAGLPASFIASWEPALAKRIAASVRCSPRLPYMVALVGIPGSGKSTSALALASLLGESGIETMVMPHDGYHYPLDDLKRLPDAEDVIYRRGAPDTFDSRVLLRDLKRIRDGDEEVIKLPAFDHARGDPEPDAHIFERNRQQVVLCEGLYLLHNGDGWKEVADMFDLKVFMNADIEQCMERIKARNQCIPGYTPQEIAIRADKVDRINALTVLRSKSRADVIVDAAIGRSADRAGAP